MARARIKVIVKKDGKVQIETDGFRGSNCLEATQPLEMKLGIKTDQSLKGEYWNPPNTEKNTIIESEEGGEK